MSAHVRQFTSYLRAINRRFGRGKLHSFPLFGLGSLLRGKLIDRTQTVYLLNFLDYDRATALARLKTELAWQDYGGKHHESLFTKWVQSYLLPVKFNLDYRKATYSSLICAGRMTREAALAALSEPPFDPADVAQQQVYIARKLGFTAGELELIVERPGQYYSDYPNNEKWLSRAYRAYGLLGRMRAAW